MCNLFTKKSFFLKYAFNKYELAVVSCHCRTKLATGERLALLCNP